MVVLLCERGAGYLAMVSPHCTFSGDDVLAEDVHAGVDPCRLGKVISPGGNLSDSLWICHVECIRPGRNYEVYVRADFTE